MTEPQLGIEATLWNISNSLRGAVASSDYKHIVLGVIFLKYFFDCDFEQSPSGIRKPMGLTWEDIIRASQSPKSTLEFDKIIKRIEDETPILKNSFPKFTQFEGLRPEVLEKLVAAISPIDLTESREFGKDLLSRTYEYFLTKFAAAEGRLGGEFYTPRSIVNLMVELLAPFEGTIYDPACGTGGIFVQAQASAARHGKSFDAVKVIGQESNPMTWRMAKLNLALHQLNFSVGEKWGDTFSEDRHKGLQADYILTNPPFGKGTEWPRESLILDARWQFGIPPEKPANYAWLQHYVSKLSDNGVAVAVMPNGTLTARGVEGSIRQALVNADIVECIISLPSQLFYSTPIPVCLWILNKNKSARKGKRNRAGEILMIDARDLGSMTSKVHRNLNDTDIQKIVGAYKTWEHRTDYANLDSKFAVSVDVPKLASKNYSLNPSEYVHSQLEINTQEAQNELLELSPQIQTRLQSLIGSASTLEKLISQSNPEQQINISDTSKWKISPLRDVCKIVGGGTPDTKDSSNFGGDVVWITPRDLAALTVREVRKGERSITQKGLKSSGAKIVPRNSLLVSSRAPIGLVAIAQTELCTNQGIRSLIFNDDQDPRFWYYLIKNSRARLEAAGNGTTFREIRGSTLLEMTFSVPPLSTQTQIADYLDVFQGLADRATKTAMLVNGYIDSLSPLLSLGIEDKKY